MAEPTSIPWHTGEMESRADGPGIIRDAAERPLAYLFLAGGPDGNEQAANAELIVLAVNAHAALVGALTALLNFDGHLADCIGTLRPGLECSEECDQARAALKLATGGPS